MQLDVADLSCRRAGRTVLAGVSFSLPAGRAALVTGRNGVGKSTLLATLAGLLRPASGTVRLSGAGDRGLAESVHHLGHRDGLKSALTLRETLVFGQAISGRGLADPEAALARVGLPGRGDLPVGYLSAGQRRRLALARLLVSDRPVWLLDEPATALDSDGQAILAALLDGHLAAGGIVVAATHAPLPLEGALRLDLAPAPPSVEAEHAA